MARNRCSSPPGEISSSNRAGASSAFQKVCHWPRGLKHEVAHLGHVLVVAEPHRDPPLQDEAVLVLAGVHVQGRRDGPRREQVLDECEPSRRCRSESIRKRSRQPAGAPSTSPGPGSDDLSCGSRLRHARPACDAVRWGTIPEIWYSAPDGLPRSCPRPGRARPPPRLGPAPALWREVASGAARGRASLRDAVLLHRRPHVAAGDLKPLPGGTPGDPLRSGWDASTPRLDYNTMGRGAGLLGSGIGTLHEATGGRPELSRKFHEEMKPFGCEQELVLALRTGGGSAGVRSGCTARRERRCSARPRRSSLRTAASPRSPVGARHGLRTGQALDPDLPDSPRGCWCSARTSGCTRQPPPRGRVGLRSSSAARSTDFPGRWSPWPGQGTAARGTGRSTARVRGARTPAGCLVHGSVLRNRGGLTVSVLVEAAQPAHLETLLMQGDGLTPRASATWTRLVLRGRVDLGRPRAELTVAEGTVQQHRQVGLREDRRAQPNASWSPRSSTSHYEPRVRDNEHRAGADRPLRDGPMPRRTS